jgi:hypothetical protein
MTGPNNFFLSEWVDVGVKSTNLMLVPKIKTYLVTNALKGFLHKGKF